MLPSMSSLITLPATRPMNVSPMPVSKTISAGTRESRHPEDHSGGILALGAGSLFGEVIPARHFPCTESLVALFQLIDDLGRRHAVALFFGQRAAQARKS